MQLDHGNEEHQSFPTVTAGLVPRLSGSIWLLTCGPPWFETASPLILSIRLALRDAARWAAPQGEANVEGRLGLLTMRIVVFSTALPLILRSVAQRRVSKDAGPQGDFSRVLSARIAP